MSKRLKGRTSTALWAVAYLFAAAAVGDESFRTAEGKLIQKGMTTGEVFALLGPPRDHIGPSNEINIDFGEGTVDTWTYTLTGSIGGPYLVQITFAGGEVRDIETTELPTRD